MSLKRNNKNEVADDIVFQMICKSFVSRLNVVFFSFAGFCSSLINIHIFDYPDSPVSGLFLLVPTSPDNRGRLLFFLHFQSIHAS